MKLPTSFKVAQTTTDLIVLLFALTAASFFWSIIIMGFQGRKSPPEFKEIGLFVGGGVLGAVGAQKLSIH